jgi:hypothetical protein
MLDAQRKIFRIALPAAVAAFGFAADAHALTAQDLEGIGVETRVTYAMRVKRPRGIFTPQMTMIMKFAVKDGAVVGTVTRSSKSPRGPISRTDKMHALIGVAGKPPSGGDAIWTVQDERLVLIRAFTSGALRVEISFTGRGADIRCTVRAPFMEEEGKGPIRTEDSLGGGPVTILDAVQKSADCKVEHPPDRPAE